MSHNMLAVKFRPKKFEEVLGQQHVVGPIKNAIKTKDMSHVILLHGPSGVGKTTIARIIAMSVNCQNQKDGEPCCVCSSCKRIESENSMDLLEFDAATNGGVNEIREIQAQVQAASLSTRFRVFIIDEAHMLTNQAANALLKTLEEPPKNVIFILATTEPNKLLQTIRSRCQQHALSPLRLSEARDCLNKIAKSLNIEFEQSALDLMCRASRGGMRSAIQFLEKAIGSDQKKKITLADVTETFGAVSFMMLFSFFTHIISGEISKVIVYIDTILQDGVSISIFWAEFQQFLRGFNFAKQIKDIAKLENLLQYDTASLNKVLEISDTLNQTTLIDAWKLAIETQNHLEMPSTAGRMREMIEEASLRMSMMSWVQIQQKKEDKTILATKTEENKPKIMDKTKTFSTGLTVFGNKFELLEK